MALINFSGVTSGDTVECLSTGGTISVSNSINRSAFGSGPYSMRVNPATTGTGRFRFGVHGSDGVHTTFSVATTYFSFYFYVATLPAASDEQMLRLLTAGGTTKFSIRIDSAGKLRGYNTSNVAIGSLGSTVLSTGTWYRFDVTVGTGNPAAWSVLLNGVSEISGSDNVSVTNAGQLDLGKAANSNGNSVDFHYADLVMSDSALSTATAIKMMVPSADGDHVGWATGAGTADYSSLDELPHDSDTTYLLGVGSAAETPLMQGASAAGINGIVSCVKTLSIVKRNGASNGTITSRVRIASTDYDASSAATTSAYTANGGILETNPNSGIAWTLADLGNLQAGVIENDGTNKTRLTAVYTAVLFTPTNIPIFMHYYRQTRNNS